MPLHHPGPPPWIVTWARPSKVLAADGVTLKQLCHSTQSYTNVPQNGDRFQHFFICKGNETELNIGEYRTTSVGIFDLYINDILDSAGYDSYAASGANAFRRIVLTQPVRAGQNIIELRVNGKNVASAGYSLFIIGVSLQ